jgi:4-hydroxy-tetrahydrodipicolinate synthase
MQAHFGTVLTAMVTPFDESGAVNYDVAQDLARYLANNGNDGLVICGTTGEAPVLTDDERIGLWEAVCSAVTIPVIAGATSNDTPHSLGLVKEAEKRGVAAILAVTPYYNRPSQAGIAAHMKAVAAATTLPVMMYDIPVRAGRKIATESILSLAQIPNIVALKDAAGNPAETANVIAQAPPGFQVYSGDDGLTLPLLSVGAVGVVGVATHWSAVEHQSMIAAFAKGDVSTAQQINAALLDSFSYETGDDAPNPLPAKAMMRTLGFPVGQARLPMGDAPDWLEPQAREVMARLEQVRQT